MPTVAQFSFLEVKAVEARFSPQASRTPGNAGWARCQKLTFAHILVPNPLSGRALKRRGPVAGVRAGRRQQASARARDPVVHSAQGARSRVQQLHAATHSRAVHRPVATSHTWVRRGRVQDTRLLRPVKVGHGWTLARKRHCTTCALLRVLLPVLHSFFLGRTRRRTRTNTTTATKKESQVLDFFFCSGLHPQKMGFCG